MVQSSSLASRAPSGFYSSIVPRPTLFARTITEGDIENRRILADVFDNSLKTSADSHVDGIGNLLAQANSTTTIDSGSDQISSQASMPVDEATLLAEEPQSTIPVRTREPKHKKRKLKTEVVDPLKGKSNPRLSLEAIRDFLSQAAAEATGLKKTAFQGIDHDKYKVGGAEASHCTWKGVPGRVPLSQRNNNFVAAIVRLTGFPETTTALVELKTKNITLVDLAQALFLSSENLN